MLGGVVGLLGADLLVDPEVVFRDVLQSVPPGSEERFHGAIPNSANLLMRDVTTPHLTATKS